MCQISIIVPIYNAERYLEDSITHALSQSFSDFELLLIDDGSKDLSGKICDEYAQKDSRVIVIHKRNTGVCDTRNIGLGIAKGKYVMFLDADDYWYDDAILEKLYNVAEEHNLHIVRGDYKAVDGENNDLFERPFSVSKQKLAYKVITSGTYYNEVLSGENFLVLSLFRKDAIDNLRFDRERSFLEDMDFYVRLLLQPLRCMFVPIRFYAYRKLTSSASNTPNVKHLADSFSMCDVFDQCYRKANENSLRQAYKYNRVMMYYWTLETMSSTPYYAKRFKLIRDLSLKKRQSQISEWARNDVAKYSFIVYLIPIFGITIFRMYRIVNTLISSVRHMFK